MKTQFLLIIIATILMFTVIVYTPIHAQDSDCTADLARAADFLAEAQTAINNGDVNAALIATNNAQAIISRCAAEHNRGLGFEPVEQNADWQPIVQITEGLEMVLVPAGCFTMGNEAILNEAPPHQQCFETPFWISRLEITNAQYGSTAMFSNPDQPRDNVTWLDARNFCEQRGGRLPTEAEWEYAARGPDSLIYPWGDEFIADNVVFRPQSNNATSTVGSLPQNASWVGAVDLIGNVWEWTNSIHQPYPYDLSDDRENPDDTRSQRVIRGGSYFNDAPMSSTTIRLSQPPGFASSTIGFRCAGDYYDFATICTLTPLNSQINIRTGPGTTFDSEDVLAVDERVEIDGQTTGADGLVWYRIINNRGWVRSDVVQTRGNCDVPMVN